MLRQTFSNEKRHSLKHDMYLSHLWLILLLPSIKVLSKEGASLFSLDHKAYNISNLLVCAVLYCNVKDPQNLYCATCSAPHSRRSTKQQLTSISKTMIRPRGGPAQLLDTMSFEKSVTVNLQRIATGPFGPLTTLNSLQTCFPSFQSSGRHLPCHTGYTAISPYRYVLQVPEIHKLTTAQMYFVLAFVSAKDRFAMY